MIQYITNYTKKIPDTSVKISRTQKLENSVQTFVSAAGSDSNNCADITTPCLHFQNAVNATVPGGEVVALNPADYGPITINQPITINGQGWAYVAPAAGGSSP